jgi:small subunit ribosomal protein S18
MIRRESRKRACRFCADQIDYPIYKDTQIIQHFITERGKIVPRRITGNCAFHQRWLAREIKKARILALAPFTEPR